MQITWSLTSGTDAKNFFNGLNVRVMLHSWFTPKDWNIPGRIWPVIVAGCHPAFHPRAGAGVKATISPLNILFVPRICSGEGRKTNNIQVNVALTKRLSLVRGETLLRMTNWNKDENSPGKKGSFYECFRM